MRQLALLPCLMTACVAGHAAEPAHLVERSLVQDGVTHRYQVFVTDGWTAKRR